MVTNSERRTLWSNLLKKDPPPANVKEQEMTTVNGNNEPASPKPRARIGPVAMIALWVGPILGTLALAFSVVSTLEMMNPEQAISGRVLALEEQGDVHTSSLDLVCPDGEGFFVVASDQFEVMDSDGFTSGPFDVIYDSARFWPASEGVHNVRGRSRHIDGGWGPWSAWQSCTTN